MMVFHCYVSPPEGIIFTLIHQDIIILLLLIFSDDNIVALPALTRGVSLKFNHDNELRTSPVVALALMLSQGALFRVAGRRVVFINVQHPPNTPRAR